MTPRSFHRWVTALDRSEAESFRKIWTLWEATEDSVLIWPDEPADSVWVLESGTLVLSRRTAAGTVVQKPTSSARPTPSAWLASGVPTGALVLAQRGSTVWRLTKEALADWKRRHPAAFRKLARPGGPLEDLARWSGVPPRPLPRRRIRLHPPFPILLGWLLPGLALTVLAVGLLGWGLAAGWLALGLGLALLVERSLRWAGEFLELGPERLVYVKTDLWRRTHRRWSARWTDVQSVEVTQHGWSRKILDLADIEISTRSVNQPLRLNRFGGRAAQRLHTWRPPPPPGQPTGLRAIWIRLHGDRSPLKPLLPPSPTPAASPEAPRRFGRHPLTLVLRAGRGLALLVGGLGVGALGVVAHALPPLVLGLVLGSAGAALFGWEWWDWSNDTYALEGELLVDVERKPLWLGTVRREIPLASLQTVEVIQDGLLPILFDFGVIRLGSGGGPALDWVDVAHPAEVHDRILELKRELEERRRQAQERMRYEEIAGALRTVEALREWGLGLR